MSVVAQSAASLFHPGFGAKLRLAREALGLTSAAVAAKLKLGERQIEAIEAEDFAHLPGETFARGFVRNYARLVNLDAGQLIIPVDIHAVVSETVTAPSEGVSFPSPGLRRWVLLPLLALGFFVLLVALLYYWLRQGEDTLVSEQAAAPAAVVPRAPAPVMAPGSPAVPATVVTAAPAVPADAPPATPAATPAAMSPLPAPEPLAKPVEKPAPSQNSLSPLVPAVPADSAAASPGKGHALHFVPALDAWIQVVDGKGRHFSKLVRAGSVETFAGEPPFKLVVGEAAQVDLIYDGHHIDLTPFIGQKVARLTLE